MKKLFECRSCGNSPLLDNKEKQICPNCNSRNLKLLKKINPIEEKIKIPKKGEK